MGTTITKTTKTRFKPKASFESNSSDEVSKLGIYHASVSIKGAKGVKDKYNVISLVLEETNPESTAGPLIYSIDSSKEVKRLIKALQKMKNQIWPA